jgi:hypothetical protein
MCHHPAKDDCRKIPISLIDPVPAQNLTEPKILEKPASGPKQRHPPGKWSGEFGRAVWRDRFLPPHPFALESGCFDRGMSGRPTYMLSHRGVALSAGALGSR